MQRCNMTNTMLLSQVATAMVQSAENLGDAFELEGEIWLHERGYVDGSGTLDEWVEYLSDQYDGNIITVRNMGLVGSREVVVDHKVANDDGVFAMGNVHLRTDNKSVIRTEIKKFFDGARDGKVALCR